MPWPIDDVNLTNTDSGTDSPSLARTDINITQQRLKEVIAGRGTADGVCELDASALVPLSRLPTVTVPYGGTGRTSLTANGVLVGAGTGAINSVAPGTSGYVLTSNGTGADPSYQAPQSAVSANDSTPGYLNGKITSNPTIQLIELNDGGNESLQIQVAQASLELSHIRETVSSASLVAAFADVTANTTSTTYVKLKEIYCPFNGSVYVYFEIAKDIYATGAYGRIYVDGVAVGTERYTTSDTYVSFTETIPLGSGSTSGYRVQLYVRTTNAGYPAFVRNFRIYDANPLQYVVVQD